MTMRVVPDCMIYLQAIGNPNGPAMACLDRIDAKRGILLISHEMLSELADVLSRPELRQRFKRLRPEVVATFLDQIREKGVLIDPVSPVFKLPRDPKDERYINLAIEGRADYLITWNEKHLTYLMTSVAPEAVQFRQEHPALTILDPVQFLRATAS